jgi:hypothetical protein
LPRDHDPALFFQTSPGGQTLLLLYVDDMIMTGDDSEYITFVKAHLREQFLIKIMGLLTTFLGLRFPPPLMTFISHRESISKISLITLVLVVSVLLRLPWSSVFSFVLLMVILSLIRCTIVILLGALSTLLSLI